MHARRVAVSLAIAFCLVGCGAPEKDVTMPDVTGKKLDVAYDTIKNAGLKDKDKVKIEGGGTFGVVMEGNWTVCEQSPAAGTKVSGSPTLTVARDCDNGSDEPTDASSGTPSATAPPEPAVLTVKNNKDFAALLKLGDNCAGKVRQFAHKYAGKTIQFDGSVQAEHRTATPRPASTSSSGPATSTRTRPSVRPSSSRTRTISDLQLAGKNVPDSVVPGQNYTFTAELGEYNPGTCLYQLTPVETKTR